MLQSCSESYLRIENFIAKKKNWNVYRFCCIPIIIIHYLQTIEEVDEFQIRANLANIEIRGKIASLLQLICQRLRNVSIIVHCFQPVWNLNAIITKLGNLLKFVNNKTSETDMANRWAHSTPLPLYRVAPKGLCEVGLWGIELKVDGCHRT